MGTLAVALGVRQQYKSKSREPGRMKESLGEIQKQTSPSTNLIKVILPGCVALYSRTPVEAFLASYSFSLALAVPQTAPLRDATLEHK